MEFIPLDNRPPTIVALMCEGLCRFLGVGEEAEEDAIEF